MFSQKDAQTEAQKPAPRQWMIALLERTHEQEKPHLGNILERHQKRVLGDRRHSKDAWPDFLVGSTHTRMGV